MQTTGLTIQSFARDMPQKPYLNANHCIATQLLRVYEKSTNQGSAATEIPSFILRDSSMVSNYLENDIKLLP